MSSEQPNNLPPNNASFSTTKETAPNYSLSHKSASLTRNIPTNTSFREQRKSYDMKKRYFTKNVQSAIESTQEVHSGWLKARTAFKRWTKVWCQVKPGYLVMYTSQEAQKKHRLGVVLLSICQVIKRPTKKEGFCFKLINPFGCSVWAKSYTRALAFSPASLTFRSSNLSIGKLWLDALHQCNLSANLEGYQPVVGESPEDNLHANQLDISDSDDGDNSTRQLESIMLSHSNSTSNNNSTSSLNNFQSGRPFINGKILDTELKDSLDRHKLDENENKFFHNRIDIGNVDRPTSQLGKDNPLSSNAITINNNFGLNNRSTRYELANQAQDPSFISNRMVVGSNLYNWKDLQLEGVDYACDGLEELGSAGVQSEEVHDSNKNFLWHIIKQLRPGMDLSKVTLPTFILEPRSFLEKLADYYYHCDILSETNMIDDPVLRLINIVKWYLSGFYKKPKGPKKPYNPILGERFRCFWDHPKTQSRTFFIAEQVSHHPPISAFHVANRKDGFAITCALLSRSKFGGNSVSAILDGKAKLKLTKRNESYTLTMPYANCRGILLGSLCLELGGKVEIECVESGCKCELDFKLAPVWGSSNSYNALTGKILRSNKVTHTLEGHWDKKINIVDKNTDEKSVLWEVTESIRNSRLKRYTVAMKDQGERESVKLWNKVTEALQASDQTIATAEKTRLEDMQRQEARERKGTFIPELFNLKPINNQWSYRWRDYRVWNEFKDIMQFEDNFKIRTLITDAAETLMDPNLSKDPSIIQKNSNLILDLPLKQLNTLQHTERVEGNVVPKSKTTNSSVTNHPFDGGQTIPGAFRTIESKIEAENMLIKQALKQVSENNKRIENDLATLKRGKRVGALVVAAIIVAILSMFLKYLS